MNVTRILALACACWLLPGCGVGACRGLQSAVSAFDSACAASGLAKRDARLLLACATAVAEVETAMEKSCPKSP